MGADSALYDLDVDGMDANTFSVLHFDAQEALSEVGRMDIRALSREKGISSDEMIGRPAALRIHVNGEHRIEGIVAEFSEEPYDADHSRYEIVVKSRLELLSCASHCRVFQGRTAPQILTSLLDEAGFDPGSYKLSLAESHPPMELRVQYNETDLEFFARIAQSCGIFHFQALDDGDAVLVLADANAAFPQSPQSAPMEYRPGAGLVEQSFDAIYSLRRTNRLRKGTPRLSSYDYQQPGAVQRGSAGSGKPPWTRHDVSAKSAAELSERSKRLLDSDNVSQDRLTCTSHNPLLRAGARFSISRAHGWSFGGDYVAVSVHHEGSQEGSVLGNGTNSHYSNRIVAQPLSLAFQPSPAPRPQVSGVLVAKVEGPDGPYAHLDDAGRYRTRLPFDESSAHPGEAMPPIRLSQPYAGPGYGLHLPIHRQADLVLAFEDGDIDHPIALGTLPNPAQKSPVTAQNKTQSILKTASGNLILLDDLDGKTRVVLRSATGQELVLDDTADTAGLLLSTVHKHRLHLDDKGDALELSVSDGAHRLRIESSQGIITLRTKSGHVLQLDDTHKSATLQSAAGHGLHLDDDNGLVTLQDAKGKHRVQIDASGGIAIQTDGDLDFSAKGSLKIKAKDVSIQSDSGAIGIHSAQALNLQGMEANLKADQKLQVESGMDASIKAGMNLKLEGSLNVESKAGVANKMTGTLTNVESSALNTIKGAMVLIN